MAAGSKEASQEPDRSGRGSSTQAAEGEKGSAPSGLKPLGKSKSHLTQTAQPKGQGGSRPGSRLAAPSATASQSSIGGQKPSKFAGNKLESIVEKPNLKKDAAVSPSPSLLTKRATEQGAPKSTQVSEPRTSRIKPSSSLS